MKTVFVIGCLVLLLAGCSTGESLENDNARIGYELRAYDGGSKNAISGSKLQYSFEVRNRGFRIPILCNIFDGLNSVARTLDQAVYKAGETRKKIFGK